MANRIGSYQNNYSVFRESNSNDSGNLILDRIYMPRDGWFEKFGVRARSMGEDNDGISARLVAYQEASREAIYAGDLNEWHDEHRDHESGAFTYKKVFENEAILVGFWRPPSSNIMYAAIGEGEHRRYTYKDGAPNTLIRTDTNAQDSVGCWAYFTPNERPARGVWREPTPNGATTVFNPVFTGTIPHPEEVEHDKTVGVRIRIFNKSTNTLVKQIIHEPSAQENSQGYFEINDLYTHTFGDSYYTEYEHQDTFGLWSEPSNRRHYNMVAGPAAPFLVAPEAGSMVLALQPNVKGTYDHPLGTGINRARFRIWNAQGTIIIKDSGLQVIDSFDVFEQEWTLNSLKGVTALESGKTYGIDLQTEDDNGNTSPWSQFETFKTNEMPYRPTDLFPGQSQSDFGGSSRLP